MHAEFRTRRAWRALRTMARAPLADGAGLTARLQTLGGLAEFPIWIAGRARLLPKAFGHKSGKQLL